MHFSVLLQALGSLAICSLASATPIDPQNGLPEGYEVSEMVWKGAPESGAANITLNGTIETVETQLLAMNLLTPTAVQNIEQSNITRRNPRHVSCSLPTGVFPTLKSFMGHRPIKDGMKRLMTIGGACSVGPRECARISCSWNAAIFLCNDNYQSIDPDCYYLGDTMTRNIYESCSGLIFTGGSCYENNKYTVYIALTKC